MGGEEAKVIEGMVEVYRKELESAMTKMKQKQVKTLSDMEEEVSRVNQEMSGKLLQGMLDLKKTRV